MTLFIQQGINITKISKYKPEGLTDDTTASNKDCGLYTGSTKRYRKGNGMKDTKSFTIRSPHYQSHKNGSGKIMSEIVGKNLISRLVNPKQ